MPPFQHESLAKPFIFENEFDMHEPAGVTHELFHTETRFETEAKKKNLGGTFYREPVASVYMHVYVRSLPFPRLSTNSNKVSLSLFSVYFLSLVAMEREHFTRQHLETHSRQVSFCINCCCDVVE